MYVIYILYIHNYIYLLWNICAVTVIIPILFQNDKQLDYIIRMNTLKVKTNIQTSNLKGICLFLLCMVRESREKEKLRGNLILTNICYLLKFTITNLSTV